MKGASKHARMRLRKRYGLDMPHAMWLALARSIRAGEHQLIGKRPNGRLLWRVLLQLDDGNVVKVPILTDEGGCIVTVLPRRAYVGPAVNRRGLTRSPR